MGTKILFLEDDILYQDTIKDFLEDDGFIVDTCSNGEEFLNKIFDDIYDLYIIDLNVPKINGFEIMKMLAEYNDSTMKMVLTSIKDSLKKSFEIGCDDYLNKNADTDELLLRIKGLIKRAYNSHSDYIEIAQDIKYDLFNKEVYKNNKNIELDLKSHFILDYLIKRRGQFVSSFELETSSYPCNSKSKSNVIRYHIWNLRNRIGKDLIESKKSIGYRLKPLFK